MNFDDLIEKGLVRKKTYDNGLSIIKYNKKVFYNNLWHKDERLLESRGLVLDAQGNIVQRPFKKIFNYGENGAGKLLDENHPVQVVDKINGFMLAATWHNEEVLLSTTGSLDSDFVALAKGVIEDQGLTERLKNIVRGYHKDTFIFEIVSYKDPHIIEEEEGVYLIGAVNKVDGGLAREGVLDEYAYLCGFKRPNWSLCTLKEALERVKTYKREGFVVRDGKTREPLFKLKSPHYLSKKFLMRMNDKKVEELFNRSHTLIKNLDEEFYAVCNYIVDRFAMEDWKALTDQERRWHIENYFKQYHPVDGAKR